MLDRRFSGAFIIYVVAFGIAGLSPFALLPFLTRNLSSAEFGIAALFVTLCQLLANFASLGTHGYVSVQYFKSSPRQWGSTVSGAVLLIGIVHAVLAIVLLAAGPWLSSALSVPFPVLLLTLLCSAMMCLNFVFLSVYQSSERPQYFLLARALQAGLEIGLCLALLYLWKQTDAGVRIHTFPVAIAAAVGLGLIYCQVNGVFSLNGARDSLKGAIRFGLPMLPHVAAGTLVSFLDRIIIAAVIGSEGLGVYMAAAQLGLVMLLLIEPFNKAYAPWLFARLADGSSAAKATVVRFTYLFFGLLGIAGIAGAIVASWFYDLIVGTGFAEGRMLVPFIIAGYVLQGCYYTVVNHLFFAEKTHILSAISVVTAGVGTGVTYALVSSFGLVGAASSLLINNAILFLLVWIFAAREVRLPWLTPWRLAND